MQSHLQMLCLEICERIGWSLCIVFESSSLSLSNPLQYSCLGNPMDRGAWWFTIHGVAKSHTLLSHYTTTTTSFFLTLWLSLLLSTDVMCFRLEKLWVFSQNFSCPVLCHLWSSKANSCLKNGKSPCTILAFKDWLPFIICLLLFTLQCLLVIIFHIFSRVYSYLGNGQSVRSMLLFSHLVVSNSLQPHGLQHARLPCPLLLLRVCSNLCPLSQ